MWNEQFSAAKILIVDDQKNNIHILETLLNLEGFTNLISTTDSRTVVGIYQRERPDLILLDLMMPHLDGFAVLEQLQRAAGPNTYLPVIVLTADMTTATKRKALMMGAQDFLTKPIDPIEVILRIRNILQVHFFHEHMLNQNQLLAEQVSQRTHDLEHARKEILLRLARAAEYRDDQTGQHTQRVGRITKALGRLLGFTETEADLMGQAATLHDIGKIGIPDHILLKRDSLTADELRLMRQHPKMGGHILEGSTVPVLQLGETIALSHHERWDGTGYPNQLSRDEIPIAGQIVAVADTFDVITHARPYKPANTIKFAFNEI
ncbi:MAG TPA: HD domain-containing phosphohydrolase, partial [Herpetosiphonaceae bacterium]|nr:HD domain-containing phosphohydrolase [Herpetosiphonaceae bacterium]